MASKIVVVSFIAFLFIVYGFIALRRKAKFRSLASILGAKFTDTGRFAPGRITGDDFSIEAHTKGMGRSKRYFTTIKVTAPKAPDTYLIKTAFFENYPDWKFAKALGVKNERAFVISISYSRYFELTPDQRDTLLSWLGHSSMSFKDFYQALRKNRIKELVLSEASVITTFRGIVSNLDRLRGILNALRLLAH